METNESSAERQPQASGQAMIQKKRTFVKGDQYDTSAAEAFLTCLMPILKGISIGWATALLSACLSASYHKLSARSDTNRETTSCCTRKRAACPRSALEAVIQRYEAVGLSTLASALWPEDDHRVDRDVLLAYLDKLQQLSDPGGTRASAPPIVVSVLHAQCELCTKNRIYLIPRWQADATQWHYIDGKDGRMVNYTHGVTSTALDHAYVGWVYLPTLVVTIAL
eukprot:g77889.t1